MFYTVVQELQRKWKSLRNSFSREQAKRKNLKSGSGGSTWKTYVYYNQLSFLSSCAANKLTTSNLSSSHDSPDENENDIEEVNSDLNETTGEVLENVLRHKPVKKQKTVENEYENEFFNSVTKSLQERERREKVYMEDPDRLFMLSLVDDLKQVPAHLKMSVKSNIMQAISNGLQMQKPPAMTANFDPYCQLNKQYSIPMSPLIHHTQYNNQYHRPQSSFQQPLVITGEQQHSPCSSNLSNHSSTSRSTSLSESSQSYVSPIETYPNQSSNEPNLVTYINDYNIND
ncbi:uncharacterized protein LOC132935518 [Metopolophium dirhodum]|uniref:uncharacterized protein LOC132935376 n=1 Tax=Metopolophium dirhodum TaxID=44670 RepID=UPI002990077D|nr:uncharacterized protein LOC132935376 [Metopolophium dirhodum]XP_060858082.1 uncharacterized protein LOC132935518 [Metopolophium dirhodum]